MAEDELSESKLRIFLSYSRKDREFIERLAAALTNQGFDVDWDQALTDPDNIEVGISAEDEWWDRLEQMIAAADVVVFAVSPAAAASKVCGDEIRLALELGKRRIPVEIRRIDFKTAPPSLAALNVKISFVDDFDEPLRDLARALSVDVSLRRDLTWLTGEAVRWNKAQRADEMLVAGVDLRRAEKCSARRPSDVPSLAEVVVDFIEASRQLEADRRAVEHLQRERFLEIENVTRELLAEELRVRESMPESDHPGVAEEQRTEAARIRSLVNRVDRWHPASSHHVASTGATDGYAEIFKFPCCGIFVKDFLSTGAGDLPSQLRADGCQEIPRATRYEPANRSNPFRSQMLRKYRTLESKFDEE